ncbi:hypothetical protein [Amycolatopsis minnesotensis]|uniref:Tat pathway signal protein n=1 Tax=Amycolatopsis minnesotensis TaxID=337894 RepID=A0ABN2QJD2_9PSEU
MTEDNTPEEQQDTPGDQPKRGAMRFQDAENTTPREPTLAEQRARRQALIAEQEEEAANKELERKAGTRRKVLIGSGVTVGVVGLVAAWYAVGTPEDVSATCTDKDGTVVDDKYCDPDYVTSQTGGYHPGVGGFIFLGGNSYRYNYGGTGAIGSHVSGGSFDKPSNANVTTKSGKSVQRGGFGISGKSSTGTGKSGGS